MFVFMLILQLMNDVADGNPLFKRLKRKKKSKSRNNNGTRE